MYYHVLHLTTCPQRCLCCMEELQYTALSHLCPAGIVPCTQLCTPTYCCAQCLSAKFTAALVHAAQSCSAGPNRRWCPLLHPQHLHLPDPDATSYASLAALACSPHPPQCIEGSSIGLGTQHKVCCYCHPPHSLVPRQAHPHRAGLN